MAIIKLNNQSISAVTALPAGVGGYGSIGEQLDMLYWDKKNGTDKWEKHIDKVKSDIPKA